MPLLAAPPDVLRWSPRSAGHGDCAVAALELACGVTYETALAVAVQFEPKVLQKGLTWGNIKDCAEVLGYDVTMRRRFSIEEETGILDVWVPGHYSESDHAVYLWEGRIIEPMNDRRQLWLDACDYVRHYHYRVGQLLTLAPHRRR